MSLDTVRSEFLNHLLEFARAMEPTGPFFLGHEPSLVDFVVAPWAVRLWVFDHFKGGLGMPEPGKGGNDEKGWERFKAWLQAISARESVRKTTSETDKYLPIYQRYADDKAQSELAKATRKGQGVP